MKTSSRRTRVASLLAIVFMVACHAATGQSASRTVQPGAPGEPSRALAPEELDELARPRHTEADVRFMQGMIPHHAQALAMTSLVPTRSSRQDIRLLAERIEVSQQDEIALMRRWLQDRHGEVPSLDAHGHHHDAVDQPLMPGMLTEEEMAQLAKATGTEFDLLFLRFMIRHHEGALTMVAELLATQGAAQEPEVFRFASDVDADQRAEIRRMRAMQDAPPAPVPRR